ncbi:MAG TPA: hypothetical protein PLD60_15450, partial [Leptospiraceae bacterium]|nr:hypothetical protein [Leptospiraceae bacterium]
MNLQIFAIGSIYICALIRACPLFLLGPETGKLTATVVEKIAFVLSVILAIMLIFKPPRKTETTERSYAENVLAIVLISTFTLTGILFSIRCMDGLILGAYDYTGISLVAGGHLYGQFLSSPYYQSANGSIFYLAHHFSPILAFYSPFYYLTSSHAIYGILLQITAAIGMYAAYRFARAGL